MNYSWINESLKPAGGFPQDTSTGKTLLDIGILLLVAIGTWTILKWLDKKNEK